MTTMLKKVLEDFKIEEVSERVLQFTGSTEMRDRDDEVIRMNGWQLKNYRKNPVFMWAHDYASPPIGKARMVKTDESGLQFQIEFADSETYSFADTIYRLYKGGFLKATSVGFIPLEWEDGQGDDKSPRRTYKKQELLELSAVPVPANPEALISAQTEGVITAKEFRAFNAAISAKGEVEGAEELATKPEETENTIRIPVPGEEGKHDGHKRRVILIDEKKGISALYCVDCKKVITYIFDKDKDWTMASAQAWVDEHTEAQEPEEMKDEPPRERVISQEAIKDEFDYLLKAVAECGLAEKTTPLAWKLAAIICAKAGSDIPVDIARKVGAVLNAKNRQALVGAQKLIQGVLDTAEPEQEQVEAPEFSVTTEQVVSCIREALAELHQPVLSKNDIADAVRSMVKEAINH